MIHNLYEVLSKMHDGQIFEYVLKQKEQEIPEQKPESIPSAEEENSFSIEENSLSPSLIRFNLDNHNSSRHDLIVKTVS